MKYKYNDKMDRIYKIFDSENILYTDVLFSMKKTKICLNRIIFLMNALELYKDRVFYYVKSDNIKLLRRQIYNEAQETILRTIREILRKVFGGIDK